MSETYHGGGISRGQWPGASGPAPVPLDIVHTIYPFMCEALSYPNGLNAQFDDTAPHTPYVQCGMVQGFGSLIYFHDIPPIGFSQNSVGFRVYFYQKSGSGVQLGFIRFTGTAQWWNNNQAFGDPAPYVGASVSQTTNGYDRLYITGSNLISIQGTRNPESLIRFRVQMDTLPFPTLARVMLIELIYGMSAMVSPMMLAAAVSEKQTPAPELLTQATEKKAKKRK